MVDVFIDAYDAPGVDVMVPFFGRTEYFDPAKNINVFGSMVTAETDADMAKTCTQLVTQASDDPSLKFSHVPAHRVPGYIINRQADPIAGILRSIIADRDANHRNADDGVQNRFVVCVFSAGTIAIQNCWGDVSNKVTQRFQNVITTFLVVHDIPGVPGVRPYIQDSFPANGVKFDGINAIFQVCSNNTVYTMDLLYTTSTLVSQAFTSPILPSLWVCSDTGSGANHRLVIVGMENGDVALLRWDGVSASVPLDISITDTTLDFDPNHIHAFDTGVTSGFLYVTKSGIVKHLKDGTRTVQTPSEWPTLTEDPAYLLVSNNETKCILLALDVTPAQNHGFNVYHIPVDTLVAQVIKNASTNDPLLIQGNVTGLFSSSDDFAAPEYMLIAHAQHLRLYQHQGTYLYSLFGTYVLETELQPQFTHCNHTLTSFIYNATTEQTMSMDPTVLMSPYGTDPTHFSADVAANIDAGNFVAEFHGSGQVMVRDLATQTIVYTNAYNDKSAHDIAPTLITSTRKSWFSPNNRYFLQPGTSPGSWSTVMVYFIGRHFATWVDLEFNHRFDNASLYALENFCALKQTQEFGSFGDAATFCDFVNNEYIIERLFSHIPRDNTNLVQYYTSHGACYPRHKDRVPSGSLAKSNVNNSDCRDDTIWCPKYLTDASFRQDVDEDNLHQDCAFLLPETTLELPALLGIILAVVLGIIMILIIFKGSL